MAIGGAAGGFVAGSIIGKLLLDKSGWNQSVSDVAKDETKLQGVSDRTAKRFKGIGTAMTVAGTVVVGALGSMIKKFVETGDWIDKMSKRTGFSAESLSELAYAADLSGASLTDVERSVKHMAGTILDASEGLETYERAFRQMGVSVDDLMKMNPEEQFLTISEAIASIEDPTIRAALAQDVFGRAGTALLPMMSEGAEGLSALRQEARDLGIIYTTETATSAAKLKDAQTALKESVAGLSMAFAQHLAPVLTDLVQKVTGVISKIGEWARENPALSSTIIKIAGALGPLLLILGPMAIMLPKLVTGFGMMGKGVFALVSPVGLLTAAVAALAIGWLKVKDAQDKANKAAQTAADTEDKLFRKLKEATDAAGLSEQEFLKLRDAYHGNAAAMAMAIQRGKEGKELQEELARVSKKHKEEIEGQKKAMDNAIPSVSDMTSKLKEQLDKIEGVGEATKTWIDYLADMGIMTIEEKQEKVDELTGYLEDLHEAYEDGLITLEDYLESTRKTKEKIEELSTTITTTAIPAARDMAGVYDSVVGEMETRTGDFTVEVEKEVETQSGYWTGLFDSIGTDLRSNLTDWVAGHQSLSDAVSNIFGNLKDRLAGIFVDIALSWASQLVAPLLSGAADAVSGILDSFSGLGGGISDVFSGIASGAGGMWTALGAAAGTFLGSLLGGGGAAGFDNHDSAALGRLADDATALYPILGKLQDQDNKLIHIGNYVVTTSQRLGGILGLSRDIKSYNKEIAENTGEIAKRIKNLTSAQGGATFTDTELAVMHGTPRNPELAIPYDEYGEIRGAGEGSKPNVNYNPNFNVNINGTMVTDRDYTRQRLLPEILNALEQNEGRRRFERALGLT